MILISNVCIRRILIEQTLQQYVWLGRVTYIRNLDVYLIIARCCYGYVTLHHLCEGAYIYIARVILRSGVLFVHAMGARFVVVPYAWSVARALRYIQIADRCLLWKYRPTYTRTLYKVDMTMR